MSPGRIILSVNTFDAIIFDCDGTLVDTAALHLLAYETALASYGLGIQHDWYMARTGLTPEGLMSEYVREFEPIPARMSDVLQRVTDAFQSNLHTLREVQVVGDVVREWHGRVPMAVASNGERANVHGSLAAAGLLPYFSVIATIEDVREGKPAPDIYLEAARQLSVAPDHCYVLEDSDEGMKAARAAGMTTLDVRPFLTRAFNK